jgi:hypothetical protein
LDHINMTELKTTNNISLVHHRVEKLTLAFCPSLK